MSQLEEAIGVVWRCEVTKWTVWVCDEKVGREQTSQNPEGEGEEGGGGGRKEIDKYNVHVQYIILCLSIKQVKSHVHVLPPIE